MPTNIIAIINIIASTALVLLYRYFISRAKRQAREIREKAEIEIIKIKEDLEKKKAVLEYEYKRKNQEKTVELEALRRKVKILKRNQYDPRKRKNIT